MRVLLRYCFLVATCGCLGSAATNVGESDSYALLSVDGNRIPADVTNGAATVRVTGGRIVISSNTLEFGYTIDLADGKSLSGTKDRLLDLHQLTTGLEIIADLSSVGGPVGPHSFVYMSSDLKPCGCGKLCAGPCASDRAIDTTRVALSPSPERRLASYKASLASRQ